MKSFRVAILLLAVLLILTLIHSLWLTSNTAELSALLDTLPIRENMSKEDWKMANDIAQDVFEKWDKSIIKYSLSVSFSALDRTDQAINALRWAAFTHDKTAYFTSAADSKDALQRLYRLQGVRWDSVF